MLAALLPVTGAVAQAPAAVKAAQVAGTEPVVACAPTAKTADATGQEGVKAAAGIAGMGQTAAEAGKPQTPAKAVGTCRAEGPETKEAPVTKGFSLSKPMATSAMPGAAAARPSARTAEPASAADAPADSAPANAPAGKPEWPPK